MPVALNHHLGKPLARDITFYKVVANISPKLLPIIIDIGAVGVRRKINHSIVIIWVHKFAAHAVNAFGFAAIGLYRNAACQKAFVYNMIAASWYRVGNLQLVLALHIGQGAHARC